jgi:hypothetical protein
MPVKRRMHKGTPHRITDGAIEAWLAGSFHGLHRALGLRPWECSPFDVGDDGEVILGPLLAAPAGWPLGEDLALRLRRELLKHGEPGRVGRHGEPWSAADDADVAAGEVQH